MAKNSVASIRKVLAKLHKEELSVLERYLSTFHTKFGDYTPKTLQLLQLINDNTKRYSDDEIKQIIAPEAPQDTFLKLLARLKEKIFESLILDTNLDRPGTYQASWSGKQWVRKQLILAELLFNRALMKDALDVINKGVKYGIHYEVYDVVSSLLFLKHLIVLQTEGVEKAELIENDITYYSEVAHLKRKSDTYFNAIAYKARRKGSFTNLASDLKLRINSLQAERLLHKVPSAQYNLKYLQILLAENTGDYTGLRNLGFEVKAMLDANKQLQGAVRYANAYLQIFTADVYLQQFDEALQYVLKARDLINNTSRTNLEIDEQVFYPLFYANRLQEAEVSIRGTIQKAKDRDINDAFYTNKLHYLLAFNLFMQKRYTEANRELLALQELSEDKEGWNIGIRVLQIMNRLEKHMFDSADAQIENLRKHIEATMKVKAVRKRDITILRILYKLEQASYNFAAVWKKETKLFQLLHSDDIDYKWVPFSAELIPFQNWFKKMASGEEFTSDQVLQFQEV